MIIAFIDKITQRENAKTKKDPGTKHLRTLLLKERADEGGTHKGDENVNLYKLEIEYFKQDRVNNVPNEVK